MTRILFVCHGNICRSVGAQYILQDMVNRANISENLFADSAATTSEEIGNPIYSPMERALREKCLRQAHSRVQTSAKGHCKVLHKTWEESRIEI